MTLPIEKLPPNVGRNIISSTILNIKNKKDVKNIIDLASSCKYFNQFDKDDIIKEIYNNIIEKNLIKENIVNSKLTYKEKIVSYLRKCCQICYSKSKPFLYDELNLYCCSSCFNTSTISSSKLLHGMKINLSIIEDLNYYNRGDVNYYLISDIEEKIKMPIYKYKSYRKKLYDEECKKKKYYNTKKLKELVLEKEYDFNFAYLASNFDNIELACHTHIGLDDIIEYIDLVYEKIKFLKTIHEIREYDYEFIKKKVISEEKIIKTNISVRNIIFRANQKYAILKLDNYIKKYKKTLRMTDIRKTPSYANAKKSIYYIDSDAEEDDPEYEPDEFRDYDDFICFDQVRWEIFMMEFKRRCEKLELNINKYYIVRSEILDILTPDKPYMSEEEWVDYMNNVKELTDDIIVRIEKIRGDIPMNLIRKTKSYRDWIYKDHSINSQVMKNIFENKNYIFEQIQMDIFSMFLTSYNGLIYIPKLYNGCHETYFKQFNNKHYLPTPEQVDDFCKDYMVDKCKMIIDTIKKIDPKEDSRAYTGLYTCFKCKDKIIYNCKKYNEHMADNHGILCGTLMLFDDSFYNFKDTMRMCFQDNIFK
jgi:hypothetical protein